MSAYHFLPFFFFLTQKLIHAAKRFTCDGLKEKNKMKVKGKEDGEEKNQNDIRLFIMLTMEESLKMKYGSSLAEIKEDIPSNQLAFYLKGHLQLQNAVLNKYSVGDRVWLSGIHRKKGICPNLVYKWEGPYLVTHRLSDFVYRIQNSEKSKPKVLHYDRLKRYNGEAPRNWLQTRRLNPARTRRTPHRYLE